MSVNVNLELRNVIENSAGFAQYKPGDLVEGSVQIVVEKNIKFRTATIELLWRTEGRGDLNTDTVDTKMIAEGELRQGEMLNNEFQLQLPVQPWSFSGRWINIIWEVRVKFDIRMKQDLQFARQLVVSPYETGVVRVGNTAPAANQAADNAFGIDFG